MQARSSLEGQVMRIVLSNGLTQPTSAKSGLGTRDQGKRASSQPPWQQHLLGPRLDAAVWTRPLLQLRN